MFKVFSVIQSQSPTPRIGLTTVACACHNHSLQFKKCINMNQDRGREVSESSRVREENACRSVKVIWELVVCVVWNSSWSISWQ